MKAVRIKEGDVFAFSLQENEQDVAHFAPPYIFGRVIAILPTKDQIIEIFAHVSSIADQEQAEQAVESGRLFDPLDVVAALSTGRWKIIKSDPAYSRELSNFSEIKFALRRGLPEHLWQLWQAGKARNASPTELIGVADFQIYAPQQVETRVREVLTARRQ